MKEMESLILSVSPEVIHDIGVKVLFWLLLLVSLVMFVVFLRLQVNHEVEREPMSYEDQDRSIYISGMLFCVIMMVQALVGLFP